MGETLRSTGHVASDDTASLALGPAQLARLRAALSEVPDRIGNYEIIQQLGEGGFGIVYQARQLEPVERTVAVKVLKRGMDSAAVLRRFELERQALASMSHPGVATVLDAGTSDDGQHYFVMEFVDGAPITQWADERQLAIRDRLQLMQQVCDAMTHAHQKGIIHRDIKPSNVLVAQVGQQPQVKVIDFGIAKAIQAESETDSRLTQQTMMIGTPEYMSPEQASGRGEAIDTRTDVYALGVLLYELLVGALPFASDALRNGAIDEAFRMIREVDPPRPSTRLSQVDAMTVETIAANRSLPSVALRRQLRGELEWIPLKAMRKLPTDRYQSAAEFSADIARYLRDEPLVAGPESTSYRVRKLLYKHRWPVAAAVAIALSLLAGTAGTSVMAWRASVARDDALEQKRLADDARDDAIKQERIANNARDDALKQKQLADDARDDAIEQRIIADDARGEAERLTEVAEREAAMTIAMNDFLVELLRNATPSEARGRDIPVSAIVEYALKDLDRRFPDQPRLRLKMRMVLSDILDELGRTPETADDTRQAVREAEELFGADDELTMSLMNCLAGIESNAGNIQRARDVYTTLLERSERKFGPDHRNTLIVVNDLATTLADLGQFAEAEQLYRRSIAGREELHGPRDYETLEARVALVNMLETCGRAEEALAIIEEVREIYVADFSPDNVGRIAATEAHAAILWSLDRLDEAEPLYREVLQRRLHIYGEKHPETFFAQTNLALVLDNKGEAEEAETLLRKAYTGFCDLFGPTHMKSIIIGNNLGTTLESLDLYDEAGEIYGEVYASARSALGDEHFLTIGIGSNLGAVLRILGRLDEAEQILIASHKAALKTLGENHPSTITIANELERVVADRAETADQSLN